jgi:hypothetical protein
VDFMQSKSHIKTLELQMAPDAYEAVIPHVNIRTLVLHLPKPSLVGLLNAALQKLQLVCHSRPGSIQDIYNIFDGLVKESRRLDILRLIDVGQSFTWFSDEEPLTVFGNVSWRELIGQAVMYLRNGLRILDSDDKAVSDYLHRQMAGEWVSCIISCITLASDPCYARQNISFIPSKDHIPYTLHDL